MQVQVAGVPAGSPCIFWVITSSGQHVAAGQWTASSRSTEWYPASTHYKASQLRGFDVSVRSNVVVKIPMS
jgi:hypothetical protein